MKIGITCYPTYGGSGALATELGLELARRGHQVHFITYAMPFRLRGYAERVFFHEVDTVSGRYPLFEHYPYTLALASKQHEVALREKLDVLHVHYAIPHATTAWIARQMLGDAHRIKVITTLHGTDITLVGQEESFHAITKFSIEQSDAVTAVSEFLKEETLRTFGCGGCRISVIPNFVRLEEYRPADRKERDGLCPAGTQAAAAHLQFPGSQTGEGRGPDFRPGPPGHARHPAHGRATAPSGPTAEREARDLGVETDVRFLGRIDTVAPLLQQSDLFLLPSQSESFGLAALEAMASGVPVVGSRVGGLPELIEDGVSGILEPPGSVEAMARRAAELLRDPDAYQRMTAAAIARASRYATDTIVPQYEALYHAVAG